MTCLQTDSTHWLRVSEFPGSFYAAGWVVKPDITFAAEDSLHARVTANGTVSQSSPLKGGNKSLPPMWLKSRSTSFSIGAASSKPYALFHYSDQASCIVTTTNFLAVYKAVNQNHTEQGVEGGCLQGRSWVGCTAPDQMSWKREGKGRKEGRRRGGSYQNVLIVNSLSMYIHFFDKTRAWHFVKKWLRPNQNFQHFPFIKVMNKKTNKL